MFAWAVAGGQGGQLFRAGPATPPAVSQPHRPPLASFPACRHLGLGSYGEWTEERRLQFLTEELQVGEGVLPCIVALLVLVIRALLHRTGTLVAPGAQPAAPRAGHELHHLIHCSSAARTEWSLQLPAGACCSCPAARTAPILPAHAMPHWCAGPPPAHPALHALLT